MSKEFQKTRKIVGEYLSARTVSKLLGVTRATLYNRINAGHYDDITCQTAIGILFDPEGVNALLGAAKSEEEMRERLEKRLAKRD